MSEPTVGVRSLGRIILILGLCAMAATALPYVSGHYDQFDGDRDARAAREQSNRVFAELGQPLYTRKLWFPVSQMRDDNPAWGTLCDQIAAFEREGKELERRWKEGEERVRRGRRRAHRFQTPALLSTSLAVGGLIVFALGRSAKS